MSDGYTRICKRVRALPEVHEGVGAYGAKPAFFRGARQFAHFHGKKEIDIHLGKSEIARRGAALWQTPAIAANPYSDEWVIVGMKGCDVERTLALVEAAYRRCAAD
jgi:hypothetical protein